MRHYTAIALTLLLVGCSPDEIDSGAFWTSDEMQDGRYFSMLRGEWARRRVYPGRKFHVMQHLTKLRPTSDPTAVQVDFQGAGDVRVALRTGSGWVIAACEGYVDNDSLVCMATATPRPYSWTPRVEVWTALDDPSRPTPIGGHIRLRGTE